MTATPGAPEPDAGGAGEHGVARLARRLTRPAATPQAAVNDRVAERLGQQDRELTELRTRVDAALDRIDATLTRHHEVLARQDLALERFEAIVKRHDQGFDAVQDRIDFTRYAIDVLDEQISARFAALGDGSAGRPAPGAAPTPPTRARPVPPPPASPDASPADASPAAFAELGAAFEERFRGARGLITARLEGYLGDVRALAAPSPAVDLGCGRGEWLSLMAAEGITGHGVEMDPRHVDECLRLGLDVRHSDALGHLRGLEDDSVGLVTAFHLAEHLPFDQLVELADQALRVLRPGGLLILESPNPDNLTVGASSFYLDPTHLRPLPPALLQFVVASRGFAGADIRLLTRREAGPRLEPPAAGTPDAEVLGPVVDLLNRRLLEAQDFAVLGTAPAPDA